MKFVKMHGCGNDYVYVNCFSETVEHPEEVAKIVSDRHFGIGSDGLILIRPSKIADFEMAMYNADGSRGEMCGNGIRCVAKYVYDFGLTDKTSISVETLAGIKYLDLTVEDGKVEKVRVNMGAPILVPDQIPADSSLFPEASDSIVAQPLVVAGKTYKATCVSMGNPHCVVFADEDVRTLDLEKIGPDFENHAAFPKRINTEFVNVIDETHLRMRVWERGSGETLACGTGTCATVVAAILNGLTKDEVSVELLGGTLHIKWDREKNLVYMTGPATVVYSGEIDI
ncbi:MAG: diaminopimelate epimerase [Lachnospiraceae bacterium]|nr:diaminopimelate epimerase [Lachnospiraceae bacterium]